MVDRQLRCTCFFSHGRNLMTSASVSGPTVFTGGGFSGLACSWSQINTCKINETFRLNSCSTLSAWTLFQKTLQASVKLLNIRGGAPSRGLYLCFCCSGHILLPSCWSCRYFSCTSITCVCQKIIRIIQLNLNLFTFYSNILLLNASEYAKHLKTKHKTCLNEQRHRGVKELLNQGWKTETGCHSTPVQHENEMTGMLQN